jgi:hypothetical protein
MGLPIDSIIADMVASVREDVITDIEITKAYFTEILQEQKEAYDLIAEGFMCGDLSEQQVIEELESEKRTLEAQLLAIQVINKAIAQKAANAAIQSIYKILGIALSVI